MAGDAGLAGLAQLPFSLRILAENLLRHADAPDVEPGMLAALARGERDFEIPFRPARVLLQDLLGVPVMVDLAALREAVAAAGGDPMSVNPKIPVDFVIDHSLIADVAGPPTRLGATPKSSSCATASASLSSPGARARSAISAWCRRQRHRAPDQPRAARAWRVDRGSGRRDVRLSRYPRLQRQPYAHGERHRRAGWGVGGIEAEAALLGRALSLRVPEVLGCASRGSCRGATATDLVLTVTELLRKTGVVGKFVEFFGPGLERLPVADRATLANMAPEYGATCVYFPIDQKCTDYLAFTGRDAQTVALVKAYAQAQGLWRDAATPDPRFDAAIELDLARVERCLAGPRRPQDRVAIGEVARKFTATCPRSRATAARRRASACPYGPRPHARRRRRGDRGHYQLHQHLESRQPDHGGAARAQRRSARSCREALGEDLVRARLQGRDGLSAARRPGRTAGGVGFHLIGFGCTTCNGNSGPLAPEIEAAVKEQQLVSVAVLSGNRNFEGRVHPYARAAYLASPPLVVAYAIAGTITRDLDTEPLGAGRMAIHCF